MWNTIYSPHRIEITAYPLGRVCWIPHYTWDGYLIWWTSWTTA